MQKSICLLLLLCSVFGAVYATIDEAPHVDEIQSNAPVMKEKGTEPEEMVFFVFTPQCFESLVAKKGLLDVVNYANHLSCLKAVVSKTLGLAIIFFSFILKVPQMVNIVKAKGTTGLNVFAFYLEVSAYTAGVTYNVLKAYEIHTYGESAVIMVECIILVFLFWSYSDISMPGMLLPIAVYAGQVYFSFTVLPEEFWEYLVYVSMVTMNFARLVQIMENFKNSHTGLLAWPMVVLNVAGSAARVFTTLQAHGDTTILLSYVVSISVNLVLLLQLVIYRTNTRIAVQNAKKKA